VRTIVLGMCENERYDSLEYSARVFAYCSVGYQSILMWRTT
jgi:hypothetical protein